MIHKRLLLRLVVLVAAMMCALGASAAVAYANYTPSNTTLTFYYDNQRSSRSGTTYDLNTGSSYPGWYTDGTYAYVTKVVFSSDFANVRPTSTYCWFYGMTRLQSFSNISCLKTSEVTNMAYMFSNCATLPSLDVRYFNTAKVTNMKDMFSNCANLTSLNVSDFNTVKVTNMANMFRGCEKLRSLDVSRFYTTNVTDMEAMFLACSTLTSLDVSYFNTSKVTNMKDMFRDCDKLMSLDVSRFYTTNVTDMEAMFLGCEKLTSLDVSNFNTSKVTNMYQMFSFCSALASLDLSSFNTANVTNMSHMFSNCATLTSLDLSSFNTANVTRMDYMFHNCSRLRTIFAGSEWSTAAVTYSVNMFSSCFSLVGSKGTAYNGGHVNATYAHIDGGPDNPGYLFDVNAPVEAYVCYTSSNTTLTFYYDNLRYARSGGIYDLNEGNSDPDWQNDGTNADVTKVVFDPSFANARPTTTYSWFQNMNNLVSITGISYLNTSEVTNMAWMFSECRKLTSINLSHFNTAKVTNMRSMFSFCTALTTLDLSSFNTSNVTDMGDMFFICTDLTSLDVSNFNTSNVNYMFQMFSYCTGLTSLDLSSFNTSHVINMSAMFRNSPALVTILVDDGWNTDELLTSGMMFEGCTSLVGGQGTTWKSSNPTDKTYAHIDGGPSNPGYFTDKNTSLQGDVNGDGQMNPTDATALINALLNENLSSINVANADMDSNGTINVTDAIQLINYLLTL